MNRPDFSDTVVILVGTDKKAFTVHTRHLTEESVFFKAACSAHWAKAEDKTIPMPDTTADVFTAYVHWVYSHEIDVQLVDSLLPGGSTTTDPEQAVFRSLAKLYVIGDFLQDKSLRNLCVTRLIEFELSSEWLPDAYFIEYIWSRTPVDSKLRVWLVDLYSTTIDAATFDEYAKSYPPDFLFSVASKLIASRTWEFKQTRPAREDRCKYHEHSDDVCDQTASGVASA